MAKIPWPLAPHTAVKHQIYASYLTKWYPILLSDKGFPSVTYAEGFAGPGVYDKDEPGSPIIAIQSLIDSGLIGSAKATRFLFVDKDKRCTSMLQDQLVRRFPQRLRPPHLMPVRIRTGTCSDWLERDLDDMQAWHQPILAVLDSYGNVPVSYRLMQRLAQNPGTEVLATFNPQYFTRFADQLDESVNDVFGHDDSWRDVRSLAPEDKRRFVLREYRRSLSRGGFRYLLDFELTDTKGESLYLIFATNHRRGLEKMKESVWEADPVQGVGFKDPRDDMQESLLDLQRPVLEPLARILRGHLEKSGPTRVEDLREMALFETVYREQHVIPALSMLQEGELLTVDRQRLQRSAMVALNHH